jgi:hypothetical protein
MTAFIERLERRALLSAASVYPVIAHDAAVVADNQHLANDKSQLAADTASFRNLVASDKNVLQTTVSLDRKAIKADQAAVKADANNPTLLAPAQTALESAIIKLSGDNASLKTKLSVDSSNQKAALKADNLAMRADLGFLRIDTQAAGVAFNISVKRITSDIAAIEARGSASPAIVATLEADLTAAARGPARPAASAVMGFAADLTTALNSGGLSPKQEAALAQDLIDVVNSGEVPAAQTQGVISGAQAILAAGGANPANTQATVAALEAMVVL